MVVAAEIGLNITPATRPPSWPLFRFAQVTFGESPWILSPFESDDDAAAHGAKLVTHGRDGSALTPEEGNRLLQLVATLTVAKRYLWSSLDELEDEFSSLLDRCPFAGFQCFDDFDVNTDSEGWGEYPVEGHRTTSLVFAMARDAAWREIGVQPRWWRSNENGGLHGDMPPVPLTLKSRFLPLAWRKLGQRVNVRAEALLEQPIPIASKLASQRKNAKPPVYLDDGNHNRYPDARGAQWRIGRSAKPGKAPRAPIDLRTGRVLDEVPPAPTADWSITLPILAALVIETERELAEEEGPLSPARRTSPSKPREARCASITVENVDPPPLVKADPWALTIWNDYKQKDANGNAIKPDRSMRDLHMGERLLALCVPDDEILEILDKMPLSKTRVRGHRWATEYVLERGKRPRPRKASAALSSPPSFVPGSWDDLDAAHIITVATQRQVVLNQNVQTLSEEPIPESDKKARKKALSAAMRKAFGDKKADPELRIMARELAWLSLNDPLLEDEERKTLQRYAECYLRGLGKECLEKGSEGKQCAHKSCVKFRCGREACPFCVTRGHANVLGAFELLLQNVDRQMAHNQTVHGATPGVWFTTVEAPEDLKGFIKKDNEIRKQLALRERAQLRSIRSGSLGLLTTDPETAVSLERVLGKKLHTATSARAFLDPTRKALEKRTQRIEWSILDYSRILEHAKIERLPVGNDREHPIAAEIYAELKAHEFRAWLKRSPMTWMPGTKATQSIPWPSSTDIREYQKKTIVALQDEFADVMPKDPHVCPEHGELNMTGWQACAVSDDGKQVIRRTLLKIQPIGGRKPSRKQVLAADPIRQSRL